MTKENIAIKILEHFKLEKSPENKSYITNFLEDLEDCSYYNGRDSGYDEGYSDGYDLGKEENE